MTDIVVMPSITFPSVELRKITGIQYYEERLLYTTLMLRDPSVRVIFVTSLSIDPEIIDYYLGFLPDDARARERLQLISVVDPEPRALTEKLLERPELIELLRSHIDHPADAHVLPFNVTPLEQRLADALGIKLYGPHPELIPLGSKSGAREVAQAAGVPVVEGSGNLYSLEAIEAAIAELRARRPTATAVVLKLNNGFSGQGNAIVNLRSLRSPLDSSPVVFCAEEESWPSFARKITAEGGVVEELLRTPGTISPSVQLRITPAGEVEILSTHDQILGGPDDQVYLGCRFPANSEYRGRIQDLAAAAGKVLAERGVIGSFGIDFLVVPEGDAEGIYLSEINLRVGGTTHPFGMARLAMDATYDIATGELKADGSSKYYVATDNLKSSAYVGLRPGDVIDALNNSGLGYDHFAKAGAMVHLMGALREHGKFGVTCVANSPQAADELYNEFVAMIDDFAASR